MKTTHFVVVLPMLLAACASQAPLPEVTALHSPVSLDAKAKRTHHHTTIAGYTHRMPVSPAPWDAEELCRNKKGELDVCPVE